MESIGVPPSEIKKFADSLYWLTYFPPIAIGVITPRGNIEQLAKPLASIIIGTKIKASFVANPEVCVLPMDNVLATKPEFYRNDPSWATIDPEPDPDPVHFNLRRHDRPCYRQATQDPSPKGYRAACKGQGDFVQGGIRSEQHDQGCLAFAYAEPEDSVLSRSADECVVALMDQWYLDYGEPDCKKQTEGCVLFIYHDEEACVLINGLFDSIQVAGQDERVHPRDSMRLPGDFGLAELVGLCMNLWFGIFLVESLTDSTIYMSYYTDAHLLHEKAGALRHEYEHLYPFDIRSSARDLVPSHLTFALYNHAALFPEYKWPLSMRTNGYLMLNGKKTSKSTGNSLTLREAIEMFVADARLSLADAGDGLEDANFEEKTANANILRVHTLLGWCEDTVKDRANLRTGPQNYHDAVFENEVNDLINVTMKPTGTVKSPATSVCTAALLITPIAPHFAEQIWCDILSEPKSIQHALWPTPSTPIDPTIIEAGLYMRGVIKTICNAEINLLQMLQKVAKGKKVTTDSAPFDPKKLKSVRIYVAKELLEWQNTAVQTYDEKEGVKKRMAQYGAQTAFRRTLPFSERAIPQELLPSLNLVDAEVLSIEEAKQHEGEPGFTKSIIDTSGPGAPAFEYRNATV
ncbi:hypothetical protein EST38_g6424 [Candolleomyces aberdarensis]|uniref:Methionyl/Valyl/Leucyl/Isoleucyl-tRNA synthetase anticodon-binding domain-containing protein n=1 Tax=Candolleomyces aberdarensis TaxID=2316362 RepID=A0A4Q2DI55_9AGAR|nr:hypothetical protein EST38_g6424 [Candolleomyces aberdarensis]